MFGTLRSILNARAWAFEKFRLDELLILAIVRDEVILWCSTASSKQHNEVLKYRSLSFKWWLVRCNLRCYSRDRPSRIPGERALEAERREAWGRMSRLVPASVARVLPVELVGHYVGRTKRWYYKKYKISAINVPPSAYFPFLRRSTASSQRTKNTPPGK